MIFPGFIIVGAFWAVNTKPLMKKLSFDGCKEDSWRVTDISLEPDGDKIHVVADVGYDEKITNKLHQIKLTLLGCGENCRCTNHSDIVVNDIDCLSKKGTELDREACEIARTLAKWELDSGEISQKSQNNKTSIGKGPGKTCIHYDTKLIDVNSASSMKANKFPSINY